MFSVYFLSNLRIRDCQIYHWMSICKSHKFDNEFIKKMKNSHWAIIMIIIIFYDIKQICNKWIDWKYIMIIITIVIVNYCYIIITILYTLVAIYGQATINQLWSRTPSKNENKNKTKIDKDHGWGWQVAKRPCQVIWSFLVAFF
jgi:hypothetical protein